MKGLLLALVLGAGLVGAVVAIVHAWREAGVDIGMFGWFVIGAGALVSVILGVGLMMLVFISARHGYDDRVDRHEPE